MEPHIEESHPDLWESVYAKLFRLIVTCVIGVIVYAIGLNVIDEVHSSRERGTLLSDSAHLALRIAYSGVIFGAIVVLLRHKRAAIDGWISKSRIRRFAFFWPLCVLTYFAGGIVHRHFWSWEFLGLMPVVLASLATLTYSFRNSSDSEAQVDTSEPQH